MRDHWDSAFYSNSDASDTNAVNVTVVAGAEDNHVVKGGNFSFPESSARTYDRDDSSFAGDTERRYDRARCARAP